MSMHVAFLPSSILWTVNLVIVGSCIILNQAVVGSTVVRHMNLYYRYGLFTLKTLLNAHKNHNLPSFVAFVDLVKAYDTANHDLLIKILEKNGAPPKFVAAVQTMYTNLKLVLKIEKGVCEILQSVCVCFWPPVMTRLL